MIIKETWITDETVMIEEIFSIGDILILILGGLFYFGLMFILAWDSEQSHTTGYF